MFLLPSLSDSAGSALCLWCALRVQQLLQLFGKLALAKQ
jgi:hypothetical protein